MCVSEREREKRKSTQWFIDLDLDDDDVIIITTICCLFIERANKTEMIHLRMLPWSKKVIICRTNRFMLWKTKWSSEVLFTWEKKSDDNYSFAISGSNHIYIYIYILFQWKKTKLNKDKKERRKTICCCCCC